MYPEVLKKYTQPSLQDELMRVYWHLDKLGGDESTGEEDSQKWLLGRDFIHFAMTHKGGWLMYDFLIHEKRMDLDAGARILVAMLHAQTSDQEDGEQ
jgi:hypothetical protein